MIPDKRDVTYINHQYGIEYTIMVPYDGSVAELTHIIIIINNLPLYLEKGKLFLNIGLRVTIL